MPNAKLTIEMEKDSKDYIEIVKGSMQHSKAEIKMAKSGRSIDIEIKAKDQRELLSSINAVTKQLRIISSVDGLFKAE